MAHFDRLHTSSYSSSVVTMAVPGSAFEIILLEKRQFFIPHLSTLHDHLETRDFLAKILTQTAHVPQLLDGAKILPKSSTLSVGRNNVTDDRQTDGSCHKANVT